MVFESDFLTFVQNSSTRRVTKLQNIYINNMNQIYPKNYFQKFK